MTDENPEAAMRIREPAMDRRGEAMQRFLRGANARVSRVRDDLAIEARSAAYVANRYARERPWRVAAGAAAIALVAGFLIGAAGRWRPAHRA
jgi:ElaB/YqjD/DUF883 family membrane-anchored ribosome-binding protein